MRIAHLSDPHLLDLSGVSPWQLYGNKRLTGLPAYSTGAHLCVQTLQPYRAVFPTGVDACR